MSSNITTMKGSVCKDDFKSVSLFEKSNKQFWFFDLNVFLK